MLAGLALALPGFVQAVATSAAQVQNTDNLSYVLIVLVPIAFFIMLLAGVFGRKGA